MPPPQTPDAPFAQASQHESSISSADESSVMPILAVTLGADEQEGLPAKAAADSAVAANALPTVSEGMKAEVMHLIWTNFEVSVAAE